MNIVKLLDVIQAMREFETTAPSRQQVRTKTAREIVGEFAYQLEMALDLRPSPPIAVGKKAEL
jgi:hypothetical protein